MLRTMVLLAVVGLLASASMAQETDRGTSVNVTPNGFSAFWSVGGQEAVGVAYDFDTSYKLGDVPVLGEWVMLPNLGLEKCPIYFDVLLGEESLESEPGEKTLVGAELSVNLGDAHFKFKAGLALYSTGDPGLYAGVSVRF